MGYVVLCFLPGRYICLEMGFPCFQIARRGERVRTKWGEVIIEAGGVTHIIERIVLQAHCVHRSENRDHFLTGLKNNNKMLIKMNGLRIKKMNRVFANNIKDSVDSKLQHKFLLLVVLLLILNTCRCATFAWISMTPPFELSAIQSMVFVVIVIV